MPGRDYKQLLGFIMCWMAVGMLFMAFLPNDFAGVLLAAAFLFDRLLSAQWEMQMVKAGTFSGSRLFISVTLSLLYWISSKKYKHIRICEYHSHYILLS